MAGMLAARVLSDIFERVIVLERDTLPEGPQLRPDVPQARHLHALLPRGLRICAFNPVYGQGMTTAALAAEDLGKCLSKWRGELNGLARQFQRRLARINKAPWMLATSEDLRYLCAEGATAGRGTRQLHKYGPHAGSRDPQRSGSETIPQSTGNAERPGCKFLARRL